MSQIIDLSVQVDLENQFNRVANECILSKTAVTNDFSLTNLAPTDVVNFIMNQNFSLPVRLKGSHALKLSEIASSVFPSCRITFTNNTQQIAGGIATVLPSNSTSVLSLARDAVATMPPPLRDIYLSIVVVGRHDNFSKGFEFRSQNFLDQIAYCLRIEPLARIEIVYVDYATPPTRPLLSSVMKIPPELKRKVRFVIVPPRVHTKLMKKLNTSIPFLEYITKNIGIRRSKGKFVLTTNPDDLLSPTFFAQIARQEFNEGILYRAARWDLKDQNATVDHVREVGRSMLNTTRLLELNVKERCRGHHHMALIESQETFDAFSSLCGAGDFIMLSKKMWNTIGGFTEIGANPNVDALFVAKMMRLRPGFVQTFLPIVVHQNHQKKNVFRRSVQNHTDRMHEYICHGYSPSLLQYDRGDDWGLPEWRFRQIIK